MLKSLDRFERLQRRLERLDTEIAPEVPEILDVHNVGLLDFVPMASPHLVRPSHMAPYGALLETACDPGGVRAVIASPPQHGKTSLTEHGLAWLALRYPGRRHAYISYSAERVEYVSAEFQRLAESVGLEPKGRLSDVRLKGGTEIRFTSIGGSLTGFAVDGLLLVDDPLKDRAEAESPTIRRKAIDWFIDVARSRRHPKTSIILMATRWHPEDPSGELIRRGYSYTNLKAIAEGPVDQETGRVADDPLGRFPGEALWPEAKPPEFFKEEQEDAYSWSSLYQGEPRGRGESVFHWPDVQDASWFYERIPANARYIIGSDFAYTASTRADYSVAVVMAACNGVYYIVDVLRLQVEPREFRNRLALLHAAYPGSSVCAHVARTELGGIEFCREAGISITPFQAVTDKFQRALPLAAAWNSKKIRLPKSAPWRDTFLQELCSFTGIKDRHDDQVDATASAFTGLRTMAVDWDYLDDLRSAIPRPFELS